MWLRFGVWTQMRGLHFSLNLALFLRGFGGQTPSPLVTCLLLRYTDAQILQPPHGVDSLDKDSSLLTQIVVIASLRIPNLLIINKKELKTY